MFNVKNMCLIVSLTIMQTVFCTPPSNEVEVVNPAMEGMVLIENWEDLKPFDNCMVAYVFDGFSENNSYQFPDSPIKYAYLSCFDYYSLSFYRFLKYGSKKGFTGLYKLDDFSHDYCTDIKAYFKASSLMVRAITFEETCALERLRQTEQAFLEWKNTFGRDLKILTEKLTPENKRRFVYNTSPIVQQISHQMLLGNIDKGSPLRGLPKDMVRSICLFVVDDELNEMFLAISDRKTKTLYMQNDLLPFSHKNLSDLSDIRSTQPNINVTYAWNHCRK